MSFSKSTWLITGAAIIGVGAGAATLAIAQSPSQDVISKLDNNQGIFVDKKSFDVVKGNAKGSDPVATLTKMGAREVSAGAIIFRSGDKLYIVDGTPPANATPQAMKNFQDNWNVSYMKNFQDNFATSYMK
jgi:hypothetical protein